MSTFENPDAAPAADAAPRETAPADTHAIELPPLADVPAAAASVLPSATDAAVAPVASESEALADRTTPATGATVLDDFAPSTAGQTAIPTDLVPPAAAALTAPPAAATLPPVFSGSALTGVDAPVAPTLTVAAAADAASTIPSGPRTRWAGIVWGLVLAAIASLALWVLTDADRQTAATDWMLNVSPAAAIAYSVLVLGAFALIAGLVGLVRRAQRAGERRRAASTLPT